MTNGNTSIDFDPYLPLPPGCKDYTDRVNKFDAENAEMERQAQEIQERQKRQDAELAAFRESPIQSKEIFERDLEVVDKLTADQREALQDCGSNSGIMLSVTEIAALRAISDAQWHAISQLAGLADWVRQKGYEAEAEARRQANPFTHDNFIPPERLGVDIELISSMPAWKSAAAEWLKWETAISLFRSANSPLRP